MPNQMIIPLDSNSTLHIPVIGTCKKKTLEGICSIFLGRMNEWINDGDTSKWHVAKFCTELLPKPECYIHMGN